MLAKKAKYVAVVWYELILSLVMALPRFRLMNSLKSVALRVLGARVGKRVVYYPGVKIVPAYGMTIGDDVDFAWGVIVTASGGVEIGDRVLIGYQTLILSSNHSMPACPDRIFEAGHVKKTVRIQKDVWIGSGCTILPGVVVGEGAVIAAGSVVTKNVAPFSIVGGVPAKLIRWRDGYKLNESEADKYGGSP